MNPVVAFIDKKNLATALEIKKVSHNINNLADVILWRKTTMMHAGLGKYAAAAIAGAIVGAAAAKNSKEIKDLCTKIMGSMMDVKEKAMETAGTMKETANEFIHEAEKSRKNSTSSYKYE